MRQLFNVGAIIRWIGLTVAGIIGFVAPPRNPALLVGLLLAVGVYNAASMLLARQAGDESVLAIAVGVTALDEIGCLVFLAIYTNLPGGTQIAFYVPMVVAAVAYAGVLGAVESVAVFAVGIVGVHWAQIAFFGGSFTQSAILVWILVMAVIAVAIAALDRATQSISVAQPVAAFVEGALPTLPATSTLQLSRREREVLQLIAAGYSDAMIASRLHLSETTIKSHVATLRARLGAKTRAEAVAIASRLNVLGPDGGSPPG